MDTLNRSFNCLSMYHLKPIQCSQPPENPHTNTIATLASIFSMGAVARMGVAKGRACMCGCVCVERAAESMCECTYMRFCPVTMAIKSKI